jgi:tRNA modification GTPase
MPVHVIDTAGLRPSSDLVEQLGIARTWAAIENADLVVLLMDATQGEGIGDREIMGRLPAELPRLRVMNKIDLLRRPPAFERTGDVGTVWLSAKSGDGVDLLRKALLEAGGWLGLSSEGLFMARERHLQALQLAKTQLERAAHQIASLELFAEELRLAQQALSAITGQFTSEDLLGQIFGRFCIGK